MKTKRIIAGTVILFFAASFFAGLSLASYEENSSGWPEFHGPGRTNISPDRNLLKEWPEGGPRKLWTYSQCGRGFSGVSIADGMIFTAGDFGAEEMVIALDMDGRLLWKSPNGGAWRRSSPGSRATPTYSDGAVYHMNPLGRIAAYETRSGREIWAVDLKARFDARYGIWVLAENVIVDGDKVLCMPGGPKGRVVALDKRTGKTVKIDKTMGKVDITCADGMIYALNHQGAMYLLAVTPGGFETVSRVQLKKMPTNSYLAHPVVFDGKLYIRCGEDLHAYDVSAN